MTVKEAIKILMGYSHTPQERAALEILIPELTESEDERIRRTLVEYFGPSAQLDFIRGVPIQKIRDWLEKQKENLMPNSTELIEMWDNEKKMLEGKDFRGDEWRLAYNVFMDGFARGTCVKFEKQKEQKPAWQEVKGRRGRIGDTPEHIRKKAENFLSKMEPPYDADDICSAYETGAMENANPAEWGEEDEKLIEEVCRCLCEYAGYYKEKDMEAVNNHLFKLSLRLKSLLNRPKKSDNWKPSEEQKQQMLKKSMPTWKRSRNNYEDPCIGSAFEKTGRRYTALYMGGYFIDLYDLYDKLPKEDQLEDEE